MWSLISHSQTVGATDFLIQVSLVQGTFLPLFFAVIATLEFCKTQAVQFHQNLFGMRQLKSNVLPRKCKERRIHKSYIVQLHFSKGICVFQWSTKHVRVFYDRIKRSAAHDTTVQTAGSHQPVSTSLSARFRVWKLSTSLETLLKTGFHSIQPLSV